MQNQEILKTAPPPQIKQVDDETLLTSKQVCARFGGVTVMSLWRWMNDDETGFPKPIKINSRNYWRLGDLRHWQASRPQHVPAQ
jgi:predicted DNA-binding transcriptional regulator AlpA